MKTFKDLKFKKHSIVPNARHAKIKFPDGSSLSVVGGANGCGLYGNGVTSFEIMTRTGNVRGWLSKKQITSHLRYIQKNPLKK